jgi:anti-anti-sigma factor
MTGAYDSHVDSRRENGVFVVAPRGDVDLATAPGVQAALESREPSDDCVLLDLRAVDFLDTSGLRLIVGYAERARADGFDFAVVRGSARVHRIFEIAGLGQDEIPFVDDPADVADGGG